LHDAKTQLVNILFVKITNVVLLLYTQTTEQGLMSFLSNL